MARGSRHTSARICHVSAGSGPPKSGRRPVRSSSAITMSSSASNGALPCSFAMSPTWRPSKAFVSGVNALDRSRAVPSARDRRARRPPSSAPARRAGARTSGSRSARMRSGTGRPIVSRQPGKPSSTKPVRNDSRMRMPCGNVSATIRAPLCGGARAGVELLLVHAALRDAEHVPVDAGDRRPSDIEVMRSTSSSVKPLRQPAMISSSCVPGCVRTRAGEAHQLVAGGGA